MFDPVHLRSFLAVARTKSFTAAARRLDLRQSTVSQHVGKLENAAGRRLFLRDTHSVELTADGSVMVGFATSILERHSDAERYFTQSGVRGRVRFGASEDLVLHELPRILGEFRRSHPLVDLELTVALSEVLFRKLHEGRLDLVFGKRRRGDQHGELVWTDRLAFFAAPDFVPDAEGPVPLVTYPPPSITRAAALDALEKSGRGARVACVTDSLNGLRAACLAGLGVVFHAETLPPAGLVPVRMRSRDDWGPAVDVEFVLEARRSVLSEPEQALRAAILENADRLRA